MAAAASRLNRTLAGAVAALTLAGALAGCTDDGDDPEPSPTQAASTPSETAPDTPLTVGVYGNATQQKAYQAIVDAFVEANPDAEVEVETFEDSRAAADAALGALDWGGDLDVFLADDRYLAELVATDNLEPVDTLLGERGLEFGDDYQRVGLTAFSANDRLQCMPAEISPLVVYANTSLLRLVQEGGDPVVLPDREDGSWSWTEFVDVARASALQDGAGPVKGAYLPADVETLTAFLRSAGSDVVDDVLDPDSLTLASDDARETLAELAAFSRDPLVAPTRQELARRSAVQLFREDRLAMFVGTRADLPALRATKGLAFDVLPLPSFGRSRSVSLMTGWCMTAETEHADLAADFIAFAVGEEGSEIAAASGAIVPSGLDIVHDEVFTQPDRLPSNSHVFATAIRRSDPMPFATDWAEVVDHVEELLARLYANPRIDLEETLEDRLAKLDTLSEGLLTEPE